MVGLNGAGKTTCVKLLCGLYRPTGGRILINGVDMLQYRHEDYYRLFTAVFQELNFLPLSVEQNVALCAPEEIDRAKLARCLQMAGMEERISRLPLGERSLMNKEVNLDAVNFSGGELQRLLLARALYKDAPVLILDEPTAALDPIAENELYQRYGQLTEEKTSLFISHRLSSTRFCDRILFLEKGAVVEEGTHDQLMEQGGRYAQLYEVQKPIITKSTRICSRKKEGLFVKHNRQKQGQQEKRPLREDMRLLRRALACVHRFEPAMLPVTVIGAICTAAAPFVNIYFSARILNELTGEKNIQRLIFLAALTVGLNLLLHLSARAAQRGRGGNQ